MDGRRNVFAVPPSCGQGKNNMVQSRPAPLFEMDSTCDQGKNNMVQSLIAALIVTFNKLDVVELAIKG